MTTIIVVPDPQREGCKVKIAITDATPNAIITITASNGSGENETINVTIDNAGNGEATWTIPTGWAGSFTTDFDAPGAVGDTITVLPHDGECYPIPEDEEQ